MSALPPSLSQTWRRLCGRAAEAKAALRGKRLLHLPLCGAILYHRRSVLSTTINEYFGRPQAETLGLECIDTFAAGHSKAVGVLRCRRYPNPGAPCRTARRYNVARYAAFII
jgi:pyrimidine deaminase RibD-like protein